MKFSIRRKKTEAIPPNGGKIQYISSTGIYQRKKEEKMATKPIFVCIFGSAVGKHENYPISVEKTYVNHIYLKSR